MRHALPKSGTSRANFKREQHGAPWPIHDVGPAPDGSAWFSAQASGQLGRFDPKTGRSKLMPLGLDSSPQGMVQGWTHEAIFIDEICLQRIPNERMQLSNK